MAVSSTASTLNTIDEIILQGYRRAKLIPIDFDIGGDSQWNAKAAHGRLTLDRLINQLAVHGFLDHFTTFYVHDLTAGTPNYAISLSENILNFVDSGSHIPLVNAAEEIETTGETPVHPISRARWQQLSAKSAQGTPTLFYIDRNGSQLTLYVWPVPSQASKIRFQVHRIPGSNTVGSNNPDVLRHYDSWLVNALAYELMSDSGLPIEERLACREDRDAEWARLKAYETSNEPPDIIFSHGTPWSNFR